MCRCFLKTVPLFNALNKHGYITGDESCGPVSSKLCVQFQRREKIPTLGGSNLTCQPKLTKADQGKISGGSISRIVRNTLFYMCTNFGAFMQILTIGLLCCSTNCTMLNLLIRTGLFTLPLMEMLTVSELNGVLCINAF